MMDQKMLGALILGIFVALIAASTESIPFKGAQSAAVKGSIRCGNDFLENLRIELWDKDSVDPDDKMAEGKTDEDGDFYIEGKAYDNLFFIQAEDGSIKGIEEKITPTDPKLRIFHKCGAESAKCLRQTVIQIPKEFVTDGEDSLKTFDAGDINLKTLPNTESSYC